MNRTVGEAEIDVFWTPVDEHPFEMIGPHGREILPRCLAGWRCRLRFRSAVAGVRPFDCEYQIPAETPREALENALGLLCVAVFHLR